MAFGCCLRISNSGRMAFFFFFNDPATTEIYTLSLHDALPIFIGRGRLREPEVFGNGRGGEHRLLRRDRKSTRLNSSHANISYAVFCLKKKKITVRQKRDRDRSGQELIAEVRAKSTAGEPVMDV